jgi:hypothetical protein
MSLGECGVSECDLETSTMRRSKPSRAVGPRKLEVRGPGERSHIATRYVLDDPQFESFVGARISTPVQTGPWANPQWVPGNFPGVKWLGCSIDYTPTSSAEVKE